MSNVVQATTRMPIIALFAANTISMVGNVLAVIAIPWFVLRTTGSVTQTGLTAFFTILPVVVAGFFGGTLIDQLGYKRTSVIADVIAGAAIALIPFLYYSGGFQFWQLLALVFVGNLLDAPGTTAREALVPELAGMANISLERATASIQAIERGSRLIGAPLAGVLITLVNTGVVLWIDAATFAVSAIIVTLLVPAMRGKEKAPTKSYLSELKTGLAFVRQDRLILIIILTVMVTNFFDVSLSSIIYPVYVNHYFGSAVALGMLIALGGGGAVIGAVVFGAIGQRLSRRALFIGGFIIIALRYLLLAFVPVLWIVLVVSLLAGIAAGPLNPIIYTVEYERIPVYMRGRVMGILVAVAYVAMPLGTLITTFVLQQLGIFLTIVIMGTGYLAFAMSTLFNPALREMNVSKQKAEQPV